MSFRPIINRFLIGSTVAVTASVGLYAATVYRSVSQVKGNQISATLDIPKSFEDSYTSRELVNPRRHKFITDSRSITFVLPAKNGEKESALKDEAVLASAVRGFFSGWVFTPERIALTLLRLSVGPFPNLDASSINSAWNISSIPTRSLLPVSSQIFGAFQIADIQLNDSCADSQITESYVDVVYGSPTSRFSGCHRLDVTRESSEGVDGPIKITLRLACMAGNPTVDRPISSNAILYFHRVYAMLLFREAAAEVQKLLREQS